MLSITITRRITAPQLLGGAILTLQVLDVVTTQAILRLPGGAEANPNILLAMHTLGAAWYIPKIVIAAFAGCYFASRPRVTLPALGALILCMSVMLWNLKNLWLP